jgi:hypothetical protein
VFKCRGCEAKNMHLADLGRQLERQTSLLERIVAPTYVPAVTHQANIALDGAGHEQEPEAAPTQEKKLSPVEEQAMRLLTGNY